MSRSNSWADATDDGTVKQDFLFPHADLLRIEALYGQVSACWFSSFGVHGGLRFWGQKLIDENGGLKLW